MLALTNAAPLVARIFLSIMFLLAGVGKFTAPDMMAGYMDAFGVPSILLYPSAILEIVGAVFLIIGFQARWAALALAAFTLIATVIFHNNFGDQTQMLFFTKNLAVTGGLLMIFAFGPGAYAIDKK